MVGTNRWLRSNGNLQTLHLDALQCCQRLRRHTQFAVAKRIGLAGQTIAVLQLLKGERLLLVEGWRRDGPGQHLHLAAVACSLAPAEADQLQAQSVCCLQKRLISRALSLLTPRLEINVVQSHVSLG